MERNAFKVVRPEKGIKIHDTLTRLEYKEDNRVFLKRKVRLCARRDQQVEGLHFIGRICTDSQGKRSKTLCSNHSGTLLPVIEN